MLMKSSVSSTYSESVCILMCRYERVCEPRSEHNHSTSTAQLPPFNIPVPGVIEPHEIAL
jgi:hypothetical protein